MMKLVSITTMIPTKSGFAWFPCEMDLPSNLPAESVMDFCADKLATDGLIRVTKMDLDYYPDDRKKRYVTKRTPMVLTLPMVGIVQPLDLELIEE
jgi:hypothetical protein